MRTSTILRLFIVCGLMLTLGVLTSDVSAQKAKKKDPKAEKVTDEQREALLAAQIQEKLQTVFKKQDLNKSEFLETNELVTWLGLVRGPAFLKQSDTDADGKISKDEYDSWAPQYADQMAQNWIEEERQLQEAIKKYQAAMAKASAQAKQRYQQAMKNYRNRLNSYRNRQNFNRRYNRNRRRRR